MADDNIVRLVELQAGGDIPSSAEEALALEFVARHQDGLRYVAAMGRWMVFDGVRWAPDSTLAAFDLARDICREAARRCDKAATAAAVASARTVAAVERLAKADRRLAATIDQWDAKPWLLTDQTTTYDLRTGIGRPPDRLDFITKRANCAAAPVGTPHPLWTAFLERITTGNGELQRFLQRYLGYCCSGITDEHVFVFAYGTGANGKSTLTNTIAKVLGEYATVADMGTFLASNSERHPTDVAKLCGARLVIAQETSRGRRWDEAKVKQLTGGDILTARFMRMDYFDFVPSFKLFISGNHRPRLSTVDEAMRRRLLLAPFEVQIPSAERDPELPRKLEAEWPAILRWCIDGCYQWQQVGLDPPAGVRAATDAYFADADTLQQWLDDCTIDAGQLAFTRTTELFASWKQWSEDRNLKPGSERALAETLADRGFAKKRNSAGQRGFQNLTLKPR